MLLVLLQSPWSSFGIVSMFMSMKVSRVSKALVAVYLWTAVKFLEVYLDIKV